MTESEIREILKNFPPEKLAEIGKNIDTISEVTQLTQELSKEIFLKEWPKTFSMISRLVGQSEIHRQALFFKTGISIGLLTMALSATKMQDENETELDNDSKSTQANE